MREVEQLALAIADETDPSWPVSDHDKDEVPIHELRALASLFQAFRESHGNSDNRIAPLSPAPEQSNARWGPLVLYEEIGRGASSVVFRALDSRLGREVAAKMIVGLEALPTTLASVTCQTVVEEGRLLARVRHANVVTVFGADVWENRVGIWMELIAGGTLEDLIQQQGPCSVVEAAYIGISICGALSAIHGEGLLHRD